MCRLSVATGISIPINTCGKGLTIYHHGSVIVNGYAEIGRNCCILGGVTIGAGMGDVGAPTIGDNVFIGPGAVILGEITIADNCYIGANAVVTKSILAPNSVVVGIPAKIIKEESEVWWQKNKMDRTL